MRDNLSLNQGQISLISDDAGKGFQNLLGEHSNLKMPEDSLLLKCYSVGDISVERVSGGSVYVPDAWGNLFWLSQPDKLQLLTGSQWLQEGGFMCRCLIARFDCVPHVMPDSGVYQELLDQYYDKWSRIYDTYRQGYLEPGEKKSIDVPAEVRTLMRDWESHIVDLRLGKFADVDSFAARWIENTWRLAGVLHVSRHLDKAHEIPLERDEEEAAIELMDFFIQQQLALMHTTRELEQTKKIEMFASIINREGGEITLGKLKNNGHNADDAPAFFRNNPKSFEVIEENTGKRGRPSIKIKALKQVIAAEPVNAAEPPKVIRIVPQGFK